jgi:hypothetical protein
MLELEESWGSLGTIKSSPLKLSLILGVVEELPAGALPGFEAGGFVAFMG